MNTLWLLTQGSIGIELKLNPSNKMELYLNGHPSGIISQAGGNEKVKLMRKNSSYLKMSYIEDCRVVLDTRQIVPTEEGECNESSVLVCSYDKIAPDWGKGYCYISKVGDLNCCLFTSDGDNLVSFSLGNNAVIFNVNTAQFLS